MPPGFLFQEMKMAKTIEMRGISKRFGPVIANDNVSLTIRPGEILALLGENGSGKTTLMNMLSGIYYPDSGSIYIDGRKVQIQSPNDAYQEGIGMVHQHFKLIDVFTARDNIVLGLKDHFFLRKRRLNAEIRALSQKYGFQVNPNKKIYKMSVSEKQTIEIVKLLYRGVETLILDEPTAVLTPQETENLFGVLRKMKEDGKSIIIITHKLNEVMEISDVVAIMRSGKLVQFVRTSQANEEKLADLMVGKHVSLKIERSHPLPDTEAILSVRNLSCSGSSHHPALSRISFDCRAGEILGVAGVSGSGQKALLEAIAGLQKISSGSSIQFKSEDGKEVELIGKSPKEIRRMGVHLAFVPEDRLGMGLIGNMGMVDNMMLRTYEEGKSPILHRKHPLHTAEEIKEEFDVKTPSLNTPIRKLSGGNVQKVLVGREIASHPRLLMTAYATRGLDINTSYEIYNKLDEEKRKGTAIIYVGEDLDVLLALSDRILVLSDGRMMGILDARKADKKQLGLLMAGKEMAE